MMKCNDLDARLLACMIAHFFKMAELVCPKFGKSYTQAWMGPALTGVAYAAERCRIRRQQTSNTMVVGSVRSTLLAVFINVFIKNHTLILDYA